MRFAPKSVLRNLAIAALVLWSGQAVAGEVAVRNDRLSVEILGTGRDVILVPGYTSSREVWRPVAERLASRHRVHLVQFAGFAGEEWTHGDSPFLEPAIAALSDYASSLDRPAYIGHSMGGYMGLKLAQQKLPPVSRVMSVDSLPFYGALTGPQATAESLAPMAAQIKTILLSVTPEAFAAQQQQSVQSMTLNASKHEAIIADSMASDPQARAVAISELMTGDARADLDKVGLPFWAVYAQDNSGPQGAMAASLWTREYAALPNVRMKAVENSRHFIMYDQPERLNALIDRFLDDEN